jgi:hypothetical protein
MTRTIASLVAASRADDRVRTAVLYCTADHRFAVVETGGMYGAPSIVQHGSVQKTGGAWHFDTGEQVCAGFSTRGWTCSGGDDLSSDADVVYRTPAGFDRAVARLGGLDEDFVPSAEQWAEIDAQIGEG